MQTSPVEENIDKEKRGAGETNQIKKNSKKTDYPRWKARVRKSRKKNKLARTRGEKTPGVTRNKSSDGHALWGTKCKETKKREVVSEKDRKWDMTRL